MVNTGKTNAAIAVISFLAFNSHFSIIFNLLVYALFFQSFIRWSFMLPPSLSAIPSCLHVFPCSSLCIAVLKSRVKFCEWTNFVFLQYNLCALVKSKFTLDVITEDYNYLHLFLKLFLCFIYFWSYSSVLSIFEVIPLFHLFLKLFLCFIYFWSYSSVLSIFEVIPLFYLFLKLFLCFIYFLKLFLCFIYFWSYSSVLSISLKSSV
jgi:hypothetical protein